MKKGGRVAPQNTFLDSILRRSNELGELKVLFVQYRITKTYLLRLGQKRSRKQHRLEKANGLVDTV